MSCLHRKKPISATEINEILRLPKATAHRLCNELETRGYLLKTIKGKRYMPGNRFHQLAVGALSHSRFRSLRHSILQKLADRVGETCNIAYPDGLEMAYSDRVVTSSPLRLHLPNGMRVPIYCTASGKLFLASMPKKKRIEVVNNLSLTRKTRNTITDAQKLLDAVDQVHRSQISIDNEEIFEGVIAVAVPIVDDKGRFYSSLAIQAPSYRLSIKQAIQFEPQLREAAHDISNLSED